MNQMKAVFDWAMLYTHYEGRRMSHDPSPTVIGPSGRLRPVRLRENSWRRRGMPFWRHEDHGQGIAPDTAGSTDAPPAGSRWVRKPAGSPTSRRSTVTAISPG